MFKFAGKDKEVLILQNCTEEARSIVEYREIPCKGVKETREIVAAYAKDMNLSKVTGNCGSVISVPYEGEDGSDIEGVLRSRLVLEWTVSDCSLCSNWRAMWL